MAAPHPPTLVSPPDPGGAKGSALPLPPSEEPAPGIPGWWDWSPRGCWEHWWGQGLCVGVGDWEPGGLKGQEMTDGRGGVKASPHPTITQTCVWWTSSSDRETALRGRGAHPSSHGESSAGPERLSFVSSSLRGNKGSGKPWIAQSHTATHWQSWQVFRCPDFWSTICLLSAPPSGPLLVPLLKLLGNSKFLFQFVVSVIRYLDIKGIIIPDK